jgi:hypothetical protein
MVVVDNNAMGGEGIKRAQTKMVGNAQAFGQGTQKAAYSSFRAGTA